MPQPASSPWRRPWLRGAAVGAGGRRHDGAHGESGAAAGHLRAAGAEERGGAPLPACPPVRGPFLALPSLPVPPALPSNRPSALLPRRELPDGGARPNAAQLKQLVVAALRELHGEVRRDRDGTGRDGWCWGKVLPLLPVLLGLCLCPAAPARPALEVGTGRVVSGGAS